MNDDIPVIYEIDESSGEATGTVHPFCSPECRRASEFRDHEWRQGLGYQFGQSPASFFPEGTQCDSCGKEIS